MSTNVWMKGSGRGENCFTMSQGLKCAAHRGKAQELKAGPQVQQKDELGHVVKAGPQVTICFKRPTCLLPDPLQKRPNSPHPTGEGSLVDQT